jgi:acylphosphatase
MTHERVEVHVGGRVQGVCYRASAREEAQRLGVLGEVRNLPDGRVEVIAEGPRDRLEQLVAWCRKGPPAAEVADVSARWSPASGGFTSFRVAR